MRKLTVKNFSVIKEAELEFGKITVLIGPQSSGKSLLCKLAYFFGGEIIEIAVESLLNRSSWEEFLEAADREFSSRFVLGGTIRMSTKVEYSSQSYKAALKYIGDPLAPQQTLKFSGYFEDLYKSIYGNPAKQATFGTTSRNELRQDLWVELSLAADPKRTEENVYIPSGRSLFTDEGRAVSALQNPNLDSITRKFYGRIAWDTKWKVGMLTGRGAAGKIEKEMERAARGVVIVADGKPTFVFFDGRILPFGFLSSGTQELLPMFNVLSYMAFQQEHIYARTLSAKISPLADISEHSPVLYLEEPEAHVFPETQYELVKLFARLSEDPVLSFRWVITTHSPYLLSSFNNLIEAGQVVRDHPDLRDDVAKIVPEQYWIKDGDFKAYSIHDGKLESILNESGFVEGNYLDQVSDVIEKEFDQLLRLEYDHTEAS